MKQFSMFAALALPSDGSACFITPTPQILLCTQFFSGKDASAMKILTVIARILLGLTFVVFGSNAFLHFIPMPPIPQNLAGDFLKVFFASGYVYFIGGFELVGGLLLLIGRFVPLGLTILGGVIVNILIFHTLMAPEGFPPALVVTILELFLVWRYRAAFAGILKA